MGTAASAVFKSQLTKLPVALTAINALALRPRYPIIVGAGSIAVLAIALVVVLRTPSLVLSDLPTEHYEGTALGRGETFNLFVMLTVAIAGICFVTHAARRTIRQAIRQEIINAELQREQLEVVMRQKMETLAKLVAGVSHELNTPLGAIKSGLETQTTALLRLDGEVSDKGRKLLTRVRDIGETLHSSVERIDETATSLRNFAHLDEAEHQSVIVAEEIERVLERFSIPDRIAVTCTFSDVPNLRANPKELSQAIATLLDNAVEAIEQTGTIDITVEQQGDAIVIAIADSGCGIEPDLLPELFDVLLRPGDKRVAASFGLPAAQSIAHRHGGHISVESELGLGSTFTIRLPLAT